MTTSDVTSLKQANAAGAVLAATTRMLREGGLEDVARMAQMIVSNRRTLPLVAVIGEELRGKSMIIQQLAPHDSTDSIEAASHSLYRYVRPPTQPGAGPGTGGDVGSVSDGGQGDHRPDSRSPRWILPDGSRSTELPEQGLCVGIEFHTAAPLIEDLEFMEAPARGGLDGAQGRFNASVLERADVVIFVTDGGALLSQLELEYLQACSQRVENILVVVAKADLFVDVDLVVQGNREILRKRIPRLTHTPVIAVSAAMHQAGREYPDAATGERLIRASGIESLALAIARQVRSNDSLRLANALRFVGTALESLADSLNSVLNSSRDDFVQRLQDEEDRLQTLRDHQQRWGMDLERDLGEIRAGLLRECSLKLDDVLVTWRSRLQTLKRAAAAGISDDISQELFADLNRVRNDYTQLTLERLRVLIASKFEQVAVPQELLPFLEVRESANVGRSPLAPTTKSPFDPMLLMTTSFGGNVAYKLGGMAFGTGVTVATATGGLALIPLAIGAVGGGAWLLINRHFRQGAAARTQLQQELQRALVAEKVAMLDQLEEIFRNLKPELITVYRDRLKERMLSVQQSIDAVKAERRSLDENTLRTRMESYRQQLGSVEGAIAAFNSGPVGREPFSPRDSLT